MEVLIEEADIELNAVDFSWNAPGARSQDLKQVLAHELGHVVGLDHICVPRRRIGTARDDKGQRVPVCDRAMLSALMAPGADVGARQRGVRTKLDGDSRMGICDIYPVEKGRSTSWITLLVACFFGWASLTAWRILGGEPKRND